MKTEVQIYIAQWNIYELVIFSICPVLSTLFSFRIFLKYFTTNICMMAVSGKHTYLRIPFTIVLIPEWKNLLLAQNINTDMFSLEPNVFKKLFCNVQH